MKEGRAPSTRDVGDVRRQHRDGDAADGWSSATDHDAVEVWFKTDLLGRTVAYTDTAGTVTTTGYDLAGRDISDAATGSVAVPRR